MSASKVGRMGFIHLHNHTEYSILDGACRISEMVQAAKDMGMEALAITDHGAMHGVVPFYEEASKAGVKPVLGAELYVAQGSRFDRLPGREESPSHLLLLAENETGYRNLMRMVTISYFDGFYYKPRVDLEVLRENSSGLIALTACIKGQVARLLLQGDEQGARRTLQEYMEIFGEGNVYVELQNQGLKEQRDLNPALVALAREAGVGIVATNDVHYTHRDDHLAHDVLLCIQTGSTIDQEDRLKFSSDQFYLKAPEEMAEAFAAWPEALGTSGEIAGRCEVNLEFDRYLLPKYQVPETHTLDSYLEELTREGLERIYGDGPEAAEANERLAYELSVIRDMGFSGYFLVVWDFVRHAKMQGIMVGPGRGSAAGSIVAYCLGITAVDPIRHGLLFERFLNPARRTMPDIDIDFCYERRPEVIEYVTEKYGDDRVAQIVTFSTLAARAAIRDAGRVFNVEYGRVDKLAKMIPEELNMTIDKALESSAELRDVYGTDEQAREIIDTARKLEGLIRQDSIHAAGVVIADDELCNYAPLQRKGAEAETVTQFDMKAVQRIGLLKMDFLGLRTLTVIGDTVDNIKRRSGEELDIEKLPLDDADTYALLQRAESIGIFQLESSGMRNLVRDLAPSTFEDVVALLALYRPGPLGSGMVRDFVERKHGRNPIIYPHAKLEPILRETYGVLVYQEQVMQLAVQMAGYSMAEADMLRAAIAKSKLEVVAEQRQKFVEGAVGEGFEKRFAEDTFDLVKNFGKYGFNKSHSTGYAYVSYQTAYLKTHYPREFMAALLTSVINTKDKVPQYVNECREMGIEVLPPDINKSYRGFTATDEGIRFGLSAVRNVGDAAVESIIRVRDESGPFKSFQDFCERVEVGVLNKRALESLIKSGAFDAMGYTRNHLLKTYDAVVDICTAKRRRAQEGQHSLFGESNSSDIDTDLLQGETFPELPRDRLLAYEKEMLGLYVTDHPLMQVKEQLRKHVECDMVQLRELKDGNVRWVGGIISKVTKKLTKKGDTMAVLILEDLVGFVEIVVFPNLYAQFVEILEEDEIICVRGRLDVKEEEVKMVALEIVRPDLQDDRERALIVKISAERCTDEDLTKLKEILKEHPGPNPVELHLRNGGQTTILKLGEGFRVDPSSHLHGELRAFLGENGVCRV